MHIHLHHDDNTSIKKKDNDDMCDLYYNESTTSGSRVVMIGDDHISFQREDE